MVVAGVVELVGGGIGVAVGVEMTSLVINVSVLLTEVVDVVVGDMVLDVWAA